MDADRFDWIVRNVVIWGIGLVAIALVIQKFV